jgi:DNA-binding protein Fis
MTSARILLDSHDHREANVSPRRVGRVCQRRHSFHAVIDAEAFLRQRLGPDARDLYAATRRELDRLLLPRVLEYTGGNLHRAALLLGMARQTLRVKLGELGLQVTRSIGAEKS